jgi:hypothetical protein
MKTLALFLYMLANCAFSGSDANCTTLMVSKKGDLALVVTSSDQSRSVALTCTSTSPQRAAIECALDNLGDCELSDFGRTGVAAPSLQLPTQLKTVELCAPTR